MQSRPAALGSRLPWRLLAVASIFLTIAVISAVMTYAAVGIQSTVRATVTASGFWSTSQREAVHFLGRYSVHGDPDDFDAYARAIAVPIAAREARRMLRDGVANDAAIGRALIDAGSHPDDLPGMIMLFRCCLALPSFADLRGAWNAGVPTLAELEHIGLRMKAEVSSRRGSDATIDALQRRLEVLEIDTRLGDRAVRNALDATAIWVQGELRRLNMAVVLLLLAMGAWATIRIVRGQRDVDRQFRTLLDSAGDGLIVVDPERGTVLVANRAAEAMLGVPAAELIGRAYDSLFIGEAPAPDAAAGMRVAVLRGPFDTHVDVEVNGGATRWAGRRVVLAIIRDIGARLLAEQERRIATNAMANISEAIVITDERMRVVTVNRAFTAITGHAVADVQGGLPGWLRFDGVGVPRRRDLLRALARDGRWQGELPGVRADGGRFPQRLSIAAIRDPLGRLTHYVGLFSDHSAMRDHELRLRHQASHDRLTALPNRAALEERAARALRTSQSEGTCLALMFVDLDGFKAINDTYGHAAGDEVLRVMGHRIRSVLRSGDFVARVGGDEFNLLLEDVAAEQDVARIARMLLELASEPIDCHGQSVTLSSSIGISFYPRDADDFSALAACADMAMYEAKSRGRNNFQVYSRRFSAVAEQRSAMVSALRDAVAADQLTLHYQPIVGLATGTVVGLQALLRWTHPVLGPVPPTRFVPLAEEAGLIDRLSDWVVREACARAAGWRAMGLGEHLIAVKLSAGNFRDAGLPERVAAAIADTGWPASRLSLEVSESAISYRPGVAVQSLRSLAGLGVGITVEGFGVGQASLARLRGVPVSTLKIDRSFAEGLPDDRESLALVRSLIVLARGLGVAVIAEGVENGAQHDLLRTEGCDLGVGYHYGRPMPAGAIERLLRDGMARTPALEDAAAVE